MIDDQPLTYAIFPSNDAEQHDQPDCQAMELRWLGFTGSVDQSLIEA